MRQKSKAQDFIKHSEKGGQGGASHGYSGTERLRGNMLVVSSLGRPVTWKRDKIHSVHLTVEPDPGPLFIVLISHGIISSVCLFACLPSTRGSDSMTHSTHSVSIN